MSNVGSARKFARCCVFLSAFLFFFALSQVQAPAGLVWMEDTGFEAFSSSPRERPVKRFQRARNLFYQGEYQRALDLLNSVRQKTESRKIFNRASVLRARVLYHMGSYIASYRAFKRYNRRNPDARNRDRIIRYQLDIGFQLMKGKEYRRFLGIPLLSAAAGGERIVRTLMSRYPYKSFSDTYQYRLANLYYDRNEFVAAADEYEFLLNEYEQSPWLANARYLAGESYFRMVEELVYDVSKLSSARDHFQSYVRRFPNAPLVDRARERLRSIKALQAENKFLTADFYERTSKPSGAIYYFKEITKAYPGTVWASRSLDRLEKLGADVSDEIRNKVQKHETPVILEEE